MNHPNQSIDPTTQESEPSVHVNVEFVRYDFNMTLDYACSDISDVWNELNEFFKGSVITNLITDILVNNYAQIWYGWYGEDVILEIRFCEQPIAINEWVDYVDYSVELINYSSKYDEYHIKLESVKQLLRKKEIIITYHGNE